MLPYLTGFPIAGIIFAMRQANLAGKIIVIVLFVGSIFAWSVMVTKFRELQRARRQSRRFVAAYRNEAHPAALYLKRRKYEDSPLYAIYENACLALGSALQSRGIDPEDLFLGGAVEEERPLS